MFELIGGLPRKDFWHGANFVPVSDADENVGHVGCCWLLLVIVGSLAFVGHCWCLLLACVGYCCWLLLVVAIVDYCCWSLLVIVVGQ